MSPLLLLATVWRAAAALQRIELAGLPGHYPTGASNFRLLVPVAVRDEPPISFVPHVHRLARPDTQGDPSWVKVNLHEPGSKSHEADREGRWFKIDLLGPGGHENPRDRDVVLLDGERAPALHGRYKKRNVLHAHGADLEDAALHEHDVVLGDDVPWYRVYSGAGGAGGAGGPFSEIPASEFTLESGSRPSVKKQLSAGAPWLDAACGALQRHDAGRAPCGLCCALHRQLAELALPLASVPGPDALELAPKAVLAGPAAPAAEELSTALGRLLAARRDWHVLNSNYPERLKQYALIHRDGTLVV